MNISKKTRKKIQSILLSDHFGESGEYISMRGFSYTPAPDSPLSVIWKKFVVRLDGEIIGYLFDDKCKYIYQLALVLGEKSLRSLEVLNSSSIQDVISQGRASKLLSDSRKWEKINLHVFSMMMRHCF